MNLTLSLKSPGSKPRTVLPLALALCAPLAAAACGEDSGSADGEAGSSSDGSTDEGTGGRTSSGGNGSSSGGRSSGGSSSGGETSGGSGPGGAAGASTGGMTGEAGSPSTDDSVVAVVTQVFGTEGGDNFSYILTRKGLAGDDFDLGDGIEVNGRAIGFGETGGETLFVATDLSPKVTRYDLRANGTLEKGEELSFQNQGLSSIGEYAGQFHFVSDDKAYFFDGSTAQVVVWDPEAMTPTGTIDLVDLVHQNELLTFGAVPIATGDQVLAFPGWRTSDNLQVPDRAAVVMVDTETDEAEIVTDSRCGYVRDGVLADDGYVYLATEAYGAAVHYMNDENASPPCLLRFDPEAGEFDEDFLVDLTTLFDGNVGGTLLVGPDNQPFLLGLDPEGYEGPPVARVLASSPQWHFAELSVGAAPEVTLLAGDAVPGSILPAYLGDDVILPIFNGRESTSFVELTSEGPGSVLTSTEGLAFSVVKLR